ncbi:MAG TPA: hypothetical protein VIS73_04015 [Rhodocyclaceae bacterium]
MIDFGSRQSGELLVPVAAGEWRRRRRDQPMRCDPLALARRRQSSRALRQALGGISAATLIRCAMSAGITGEQQEW